MAEYIERETFIESQHNIYCVNCDRRKNSKGKFVYFVGDAPCRACGIMDVLDAIEDAPAADVRPVVFCKDCMHSVQGKESLKCEKHRYVWNNMNRWVNDEDFCCWGAKREES